MEKVINLEYGLLNLKNDFLKICLLEMVISKIPLGLSGPPSGCLWGVGNRGECYWVLRLNLR